MDSILGNRIPMREEEPQRFRELPEFLEKIFKLLFVLIGFMATGIGEQFYTKHPNILIIMAVLILLFFSLWLLGTMIGHLCENLAKRLSWIMILIGIVFLVLVLAIINPVLAWFASLFMLGILAVIAYYYSEELCKLFVSPVSDMIDRLVEKYRGQGADDHLPRP